MEKELERLRQEVSHKKEERIVENYKLKLAM